MRPQFWSLDSVYHAVKGDVHPFECGKDAREYVRFLRPEGKVVLDVGASKNLDSSFLFLKAGAKKVLAVERERIETEGHPQIEIFNEPFDPEKHLLGLDWDCAKIDIEGYEALALPFLSRVRRPLLVEVHSGWLMERFAEQGFRVLTMHSHSYRSITFGLMTRSTEAEQP